MEREKNKSRMWGKKKRKTKNVSPEKFVQQLLNVTFQQEQQQSAVWFIYLFH